MSKNSIEWPPSVASCLWSYDLDALDLKKDRRTVITQVFNYGNWEAVKWVRSRYSDEEIKDTVLHPARGRWFKQALNFWLLELGVEAKVSSFQHAILDVRPVRSAHEL